MFQFEGGWGVGVKIFKYERALCFKMLLTERVNRNTRATNKIYNHINWFSQANKLTVFNRTRRFGPLRGPNF